MPSDPPLIPPENIIDPEILSTILAKSTVELTDPEIDILIAAFRKERAAFISAQAAGKAKKASPINAAAAKAAASSLTFEELDL